MHAVCTYQSVLTCCRHEFEFAGPVYEVERDYESRSALVEMKRYVRLLSLRVTHFPSLQHTSTAEPKWTRSTWSATV